PAAYEFVDWLAEAGQRVWQMLPLNPPDRHGSPYKARSAFAAWPGLLASPDAEVDPAEVEAFRSRHAFWIEGWEAAAGRRAVEDQVRFEREWASLRSYAADRGVLLMGDVPIYVAPGSADQRAWPELFRDDAVAGVPPDAYSEDGQLWGNPLYDWPALRRSGYAWWTARFRRVFELFDLARIDHFRGFVAYWAVPRGARTAKAGRWRRGPGAAVFRAAAAELGSLPVLAEDLGDITPPVRALRTSLGFPGMAILQFAFNPGDEGGTHDPVSHERHQVVYTGTHDNDTVVGWWDTLPPERRSLARRALTDAGIDDIEPINWSLIRLALASPCDLAMMQAQDILGLGSEARMNMPGTTGRSWHWRLEPGALTAEHAARLRELTAAAGRL
ncbi:MAG: 4-alpha-glucanotransferase, partial [Thermoleophilaceae bacterium]|nr:4-alpha-glucanotransferase [Thermoleophilaceae bacterium]